MLFTVTETISTNLTNVYISINSYLAINELTKLLQSVPSSSFIRFAFVPVSSDTHKLECVQECVHCMDRLTVAAEWDNDKHMFKPAQLLSVL